MKPSPLSLFLSVLYTVGVWYLAYNTFRSACVVLWSAAWLVWAVKFFKLHSLKTMWFGDVALVPGDVALVPECRFVVALTCRPIYPCLYSQEAGLVPYPTWTSWRWGRYLPFLGTRLRLSFTMAAFVCVSGTRLWLMLACSAQDICREIAALRFKKILRDEITKNKENPRREECGEWVLSVHMKNGQGL